MKIRFACPTCTRTDQAQLPTVGDWQCPRCDHIVALPREAVTAVAEHCLLCGNHELYRKKDFPHWLGMAILATACFGSVIPYALHRPVWTWAILIGSAVIDGGLYLLVGDVSVCYRCATEYRQLPAGVVHPPYELEIGERYRQERIRRELMEAGNFSTHSKKPTG